MHDAKHCVPVPLNPHGSFFLCVCLQYKILTYAMAKIFFRFLPLLLTLFSSCAHLMPFFVRFFLQSQRIDFTSKSHSHAHFFHPWNFSSVDTKMWLCAQNLHFILGSVLFFHLICFSKSKLHGNSGNLLTNCLWLYNPKSLYLLFILCTS